MKLPAIRYTLYAILGLLLLLFLPSSLGAEEPVKEKPLSTELPVIVVKGKDRSYLEITRARTFPLMEHRGRKSSVQSPFEAELTEKTYYHSLFFPEIEKEIEKIPPLAKPFIEERKEIYPIALLEPRLEKPLISYYTPWKYTRTKKVSFIQHRGEKRLTQPLIQLPLGEKIYYPTPREKSPLPYFHISASVGGYGSLAYQLDYGKEKGKVMYLLTLGRISSSEGAKYKEKPLAKGEDWLNMESIWTFSKKKRLLFDLDGYQKKIDLPQGERNKNKLDLKGNFTLELQKGNILRVLAWLERAELTGELEHYEEITPGAQIELGIPDTPLHTGIKAEYSFYANNQIHLWIRNEAITFKRIKNLTGELEIGIKQIRGAGSGIIPHLKLLYQIDPRREFQVVVEKKFYSLGLADLYLFRDYVEVNEDPNFNKIVNIWDCKGEFKYKLSPRLDFSLGGFFKTGQDIIWNWNEDSLVRPENCSMNSRGAQLNLRHFSETFEQELSWTLQTAENTQDSSKVIPHCPQSIIDIWLRWEKDSWRVEAKTQFVGERYYEERTEDKLSPGLREILKISKTMGKSMDLYIQLELNDYQLWKDYSLPRGKFSLGINFNLY